MENSQGNQNKGMFFMQRALKNDKIVVRKKSISDNGRLAT